MAAAAAASRRLQSLICRSTASLRHVLPPETRLAALDITKSHVSIAISDREQESAVPFGILARLSPTADPVILQSAFGKVEEALDISALIVGVSPDREPDMELIDALVEKDVFPDLYGVLFYSEAHALQRAVASQRDFVDAMQMIPERLETRKQKRFAAAMNPKIAKEELMMSHGTRAQISATEILQAVLQDLQR